MSINLFKLKQSFDEIFEYFEIDYVSCAHEEQKGLFSAH